MKHEWRKKEKDIYLPKTVPEYIDVPTYTYLSISGEGNPNSPFFADYIGVLYSVSYALKMGLKKGAKPIGYYDYTVYPLEGIWDINERAKETYDGNLNKDDLIFNLMIRQPSFIDMGLVQDAIGRTKIKKPNQLLSQVKFEQITDGRCIQMMHIGSYDNEADSFDRMEVYALQNGYVRESKQHREIYLSDFRKIAADKLKTVLRFKVK